MKKKIPEYLDDEGASRSLAYEIELWWAKRGKVVKTVVFRCPEGFWCIRSDLSLSGADAAAAVLQRERMEI